MKLEILLVVFVAIGALQAATVKPTHEPNEYESITFFYNRNTQNLLMKKSDRHTVKCYIETLTDAQKVQVHRDNGLKMLEFKVVRVQWYSSNFDVQSLTKIQSCPKCIREPLQTY